MNDQICTYAFKVVHKLEKLVEAKTKLIEYTKTHPHDASKINKLHQLIDNEYIRIREQYDRVTRGKHTC
jgi:hypothetical protein